nr:hypothetical protein [Kineobactrum salinum]
MKRIRVDSIGPGQPAGKTHRHNRQRHEERRQRERRRTVGRADIDQNLSQRHRGEDDEGVDGQYLAPGLGPGLVVEPAFDHGVEATDHGAGEKPQQHPGQPAIEHLQREYGADHYRCQDAEAADVTHLGDDFGDQHGAGDEANEITRSADPDEEIRHAVAACTQWCERELHALAYQQQTGG